MLPSAWVKSIASLNVSATAKVKDLVTAGIQDDRIYPLHSLAWRKDGSSSMAALTALFGLAIELNVSQLHRPLESGSRSKSVGVTLDRLQLLTGFARANVVSGLRLLCDLRAIAKIKVGRANQYQLLGLGEAGGFSLMPQSALQEADGTLIFKSAPRTRRTLFALKLFMLLIARRNGDTNFTSISYDGISRYSNIRREDIPSAINMLEAWGLISVARGQVASNASPDLNERINHYKIVGVPLSLKARRRGFTNVDD